MAIDRRCFMVGTAVALAAGTRLRAASAKSAGFARAGEAADFASACRLKDGGYGLVLLTGSGQVVRQIPLSARGHDIAIDRASGRAVAFARRPGFFAVAFDLAGRDEPHVFAPEPGRHFFGHGVFADGGRILLTAEHDIATGAGLIGIYDASGSFKRVGEFPSHGVGPHEAVLLGDGTTLAVANGGIATDPETGRVDIEVFAMEPSLAFLDWKTGDLKAQHKLPQDLNKLSIRHIAANGEGEVWFGGQWRGGIEEAPELIGWASRDKEISILEPAAPLGVALKGYVGSVAISPDGRYLAASAPRAGRIVYVDTQSGKIASETTLGDGCGLVGLDDDVFALSSGLGVVQIEKPGEAVRSKVTVAGVAFDNHLRRVR